MNTIKIKEIKKEKKETTKKWYRSIDFGSHRIKCLVSSTFEALDSWDLSPKVLSL